MQGIVLPKLFFRVFLGLLSLAFSISWGISRAGAQAGPCPFMEGAMIDACTPVTPIPTASPGGSSEGDNEILALRNGNAELPVANVTNSVAYYNMTFPVSPPTAGQNITDNFVSNTLYVDALNGIAGCDLFVDGVSAGTIQAGAPFWIFDGNPGPGFPYDFSHLCLNGPIYLLFSTDSTWGSIGNFKNNDAAGSANMGGNPRYLRLDFSGFDAACEVLVYDYIPNSLLNQGGTSSGAGNYDGGYVNFDPAGGTASAYLNDGGCSPFELFPPPPTEGDDAICQTTGGEQPAEFETTFCDDEDPCTLNLCTVDLQAEPFTPGQCSNPPGDCVPTPSPSVSPEPSPSGLPDVTPSPPPFGGIIEGSGCALSARPSRGIWAYGVGLGMALSGWAAMRSRLRRASDSRGIQRREAAVHR